MNRIQILVAVAILALSMLAACDGGTVYDKTGTLCGAVNAPMTPLDNGMFECD